jgi:hypothetical protein
MEYVRSTSTSMKALESKNVTMIWAEDGWCYIPELHLRQKFNETHYYREDWSGIIAMPEYIEKVTWALYSKEPRVWREDGEVYSQKLSTQKGCKYTRPSRPSRRL